MYTRQRTPLFQFKIVRGCRRQRPQCIQYGYRVNEANLPKLEQPKPDFHLLSVRDDRERVEIRRPMRGTLGCHVRSAILPYPDTADAVSAIHGEVKRGAAMVPICKHGASIRRICMPIYSKIRPRAGIHIFPEEIPKTSWTTFQTSYAYRRKLSSLVQRELAHLSSAVQKQTVETLWDMHLHMVHLCVREFEMLEVGYDFSPGAWLPKTSYTNAEKTALLQLLSDHPELTKKDFVCKCFIKAESYPEMKYPRPIKSRTDRFKIEVGPTFQSVNEQLFSHRAFIKKIPINERPQYIFDILQQVDEIIDGTDFSAYESHFIACVMYAIEFTFYSYVLWKHKEHHDWFMALITKVLANKNKFIFKFFTSVMNATRASGEMNTSSGNSFTNYGVYTYLARAKGAVSAQGVHEGDDGLTKTIPQKCRPTTEDYANIGWSCKMQSTKNISEASFCGLVFDDEDKINVCDIKQALCEFGWTREKYTFSNQTTKKALIRAKGFSMIYQYSGCPILDALGHYALRVTDETVVKEKLKKMVANGTIFEDRYKKELLWRCLDESFRRPARKMSPPNTRKLVSRLYNIAEDKQLQTEKYLDNLNVIQPLEIDLDFPALWRKTWDRYVRPDYDKHFALTDASVDRLISLRKINEMNIIENISPTLLGFTSI